MEEAFRLASVEDHDLVEFEHRVRAASGDWRWVLARGQVVARDEGGKATRVVGTCADITERKLMVARLHMADRMASVGTLAAGVAHEINNPLAYVTGNLGYAREALQSLVKQGGGDPSRSAADVLAECVGSLGDAQDGAERVRQIVRDLKVFSRPDEERRAPVTLSAVIGGSLRLAEAEIRLRARLVTRLAELPPVLANEARLSQVFLNLLLNAAQAIPEGQPEANQITVETRLGSPGRVIAEVSDTGSGIAPNVLKRIFDPFFTTKPVGVGTGLGLSICHSIITALGGEIEAVSEVGKGTTFRIALPVTSATHDAAPPPAQVHASRRARILVVDDEPRVCQAVERMLAAEHDTVSESDPRDAARRIRAGERFDVILSDISMNEMTGIELHAMVASTVPDLAHRMLFITGGALTPAAAAFLDERADCVLDKPLTREVVLSAIAHVISR
jgi:signal transduction histidine kinase/CheY-like chemotaxis protein